MPVCKQLLLCEVVDYLGGLRCGEKADDGAVAEEAQVPVVSDDVYWGATPGSLVSRHLTRADVVDSRDVAPVEAHAGTMAEQRLPGRIGPRNERARDEVRLGGAADAKVPSGDNGAAVQLLDAVVVGCPVDVEGEVVMHGGEAEEVSETGGAPDALLGGDEVGETTADQGEASEFGNVVGGDVVEDVSEEFVRERGDGAGGLGHALYFRGDGLDGEGGEAFQEFRYGLSLGLLVVLGFGGGLGWLRLSGG